MAVEHLVKPAGDPRVGMEHQVLADQTAGIGKAIGEACRRGIEQKARRPDGIAGEDDDLGRLEMLGTLRVIVDDTRRHAVFIGGDLAHPAARLELDAGADGGRANR